MLRTDTFFWNLDRNAQTAEWANQLITRYRWDWRPVVQPTYYNQQMALLLSMQDLNQTVRKYFDDEEFLRNTKFEPVPVMEKFRNILIDKIKKSGIKPYIKATDPSSRKNKELDKFRLATRSKHEADINSNRKAVGIPDYKVNPKDDFNGNVGDFDQMGMNEGNQSQVQFFFDNFYKLKYEADAQTIVNSFLNLNMVEDDIPRYVNDILGVKVTCKQDYISPLSGQIVTKYLQPSQTFAIFGRRRDALDAPVKGWEMQITVHELMQQLGNAFNFEKDWIELIRAINYGSNTTFDGFLRGNNYYNMNAMSVGVNDVPLENKGNEQNYTFLRWEDILNYKVYFGYIEFAQPYYYSEKVNKKTGVSFPVDYTFKPTERSLYEKQSWGAYTMKVSNYIATGTATQKLYGYGELFHQLTYGQYDEYASGSISIIREEGKSAVDVAKIYIDLANYAYYKMLWAIHRSKPDVWSWSYESIREVAMKMQPIQEGTNTPQTAGFDSAINNLIEMFQKKLVMLHTYPIVDGNVVGGGGMPHTKIPGALDALAIQLREFVLEWAELQIADKIGLGGVSGGKTPNPREGLKLNEMYQVQSDAATGYIPEMVEKTFEHTAKITLLYCQDIIQHKSSVPYNFLLNLVGQDVIDSVESLDNVAAHRLGIFVDSLNVAQMREDMIQQASIAQQQGNITFFEYLMIKSIDDPRKAGIIFSYYQENQDLIKQQRAMQLQQQKQQGEMQIKQLELQIEQTKAQALIQGKQIDAKATVVAAQISAKAKLDVKDVAVASEAPKIDAKAQAEQAVLTHKAAVENEKPLV